MRNGRKLKDRSKSFFKSPLSRGEREASAGAGVCYKSDKLYADKTHPSTPLKRGIAQPIAFENKKTTT
jgi:hypothetical protein